MSSEPSRRAFHNYLMHGGVDRITEKLHPSNLPENRVRTSLFDLFHNTVMPQTKTLLQCRDQEQTETSLAWITFFGTQVNNKPHFICHIAEQLATSAVSNGCDSRFPDMPTIIFGEKAYIPKGILALLKANCPLQHRDLPTQGALYIAPADPTTIPSPPLPTPETLFHIGNVFNTTTLQIASLAPQGIHSLSFRKSGIPIAWWTHESRSAVIYNALQTKTKELAATPSQHIQDRVDLYKRAIALEKQITTAETNVTCAQNALDRLQANSQIPADRKQEQISFKENQLKEKKDLVTKALDDLLLFRKQHHKDLPRSYVEPTFQIAFEANGVYKQLREGGLFEAIEIPDKATVSDQNEVHLPYQ